MLLIRNPVCFKHLAAALTVALLGVADGAAAQRAERYELSGSHVAVYNLAGRAVIEGGSGSAVVVQVTRGGADERELSVETGPIRGLETLRVIYPDEELVYRPASRGGRVHTSVWVRDDGTFGDNDRRGRGRGRGGRHKIEIRSSGSGLEAHADLRILVPRGQQFSLYLGAGAVTVRNVDGELRVDTQVGGVETSGTRGMLIIDTGSGHVSVTDAEGEVDIDTGSGSVSVTGMSGDLLRIDTGSGQVTASRVSVTDLDIDTGSGGIDLASSSARNVLLDTGSGSVDADLSGTLDLIEVDTGSGSVILTLPESFSARVEIDTGSGRIEVDFPLEIRRWERDHVVGVIGSGTGKLVVDTGSGNVTVRKG